MSNYPPGTSESDPNAPWNQVAPDVECLMCGYTEQEGDADGECPACEDGTLTEQEAPEPDYDSMPGGADDY